MSRRVLLGLAATSLGWFVFHLGAGRVLAAAEFGRLSLATSAAATVFALALAVILALRGRRRPGSEAAASPVSSCSGVALFGTTSAIGLLAAHLDRLTIPVFVDLSMLGYYAATVNLLVGFELLLIALGPRLLERLDRQGEVSLQRELLLPLGLAGGGFLVLAAFGPRLLHLLYAGKYDSAEALILPLAAVGVLRVLWLVPGAVIATRFQPSEHARLLALELGLTILHLGLLIVFLPLIGLMGAVLCAGVAAALRLGGGALLAHTRLARLRREAAASPP